MGAVKKAVVLLSGGLDSATALFWAKSEGYHTHCIGFDYGQRHRKEMSSAMKVARVAMSSFEVVPIRLPWGGSSLLRRSGPLRTSRSGLPSTYVPARNTIFLSFALSCADAVGAEAVVIGANAVDYSGYPDCRPAYLKAMEKAAVLGTRRGARGGKLRILSPLVRLTKAQIVRLGTGLGVPYRLTWSCYEGGRRPCGVCDSCIFRAKGFKDAGLKDPLLD
ncbi:MAG: 7-cyano-7-deazaguanine synthase QueC [Elusimicrobia bacterium RIFCSPLOWO2_01_FULL_60_11]|nr:MAG: 7-cyano-7-deazaguanine synthase QueC [Elusimicrobia bacterium RIFCSPLOWO2_01_FULL_60_11]